MFFFFSKLVFVFVIVFFLSKPIVVEAQKCMHQQLSLNRQGARAQGAKKKNVANSSVKQPPITAPTRHAAAHNQQAPELQDSGCVPLYKFEVDWCPVALVMSFVMTFVCGIWAPQNQLNFCRPLTASKSVNPRRPSLKQNPPRAHTIYSM